jgi:hypothetical protein
MECNEVERLPTEASTLEAAAGAGEQSATASAALDWSSKANSIVAVATLMAFLFPAPQPMRLLPTD